jgi:nucleoid DNA-binding protein
MKILDLVKGKKAAPATSAKTVYTTDVVRSVAKKHRLSQRVVAEVLGGVLAEIQGSVAQGNTVQLTNFGTFYSALRAPSQARNFKTNQLIDIPEMYLPHFRAGQALKRSVRGKKR